MIYQICNQNHEQIETFSKISFIKKSSLSSFNYLSLDDNVKTIVSNLPDTASAIIFNLLPENISLSYNTKVTESGKEYAFSARFTVTPQDKNLQGLLESYNNEEGIVLVEKPDATHIYGSTLSPVLFTYNELHSNSGSGLKGYGVVISGTCLGSSRILEDVVINIFNRGLAFQLAGTI